MTEKESETDRESALHELEEWLEKPMLFLGLVWMGLLIVELTRGLNPALEVLGTIIWVVFLIDFAVRLALAPRKVGYLKRNWLTAISLVVPALRVARLLRLARFLHIARGARGLRLFRVVSTLNRGMRTLGNTMSRRGAGYVFTLTVLVTLIGAAAMLAFEKDVTGGGIRDYGTALWWTAMMMTTMGSEFWPRTPEGRLLCVFLAVYAFAVFGYVTATLATFFIGQDVSAPPQAAQSAAPQRLHEDIEALRRELIELRAALKSRD